MVLQKLPGMFLDTVTGKENSRAWGIVKRIEIKGPPAVRVGVRICTLRVLPAELSVSSSDEAVTLVSRYLTHSNYF